MECPAALLLGHCEGALDACNASCRYAFSNEEAVSSGGAPRPWFAVNGLAGVSRQAQKIDSRLATSAHPEFP